MMYQLSDTVVSVRSVASARRVASLYAFVTRLLTPTGMQPNSKSPQADPYVLPTSMNRSGGGGEIGANWLRQAASENAISHAAIRLTANNCALIVSLSRGQPCRALSPRME
jgi:hypothetical protein